MSRLYYLATVLYLLLDNLLNALRTPDIVNFLVSGTVGYLAFSRNLTLFRPSKRLSRGSGRDL